MSGNSDSGLKKSQYVSKLYRTGMLFGSFLAFGIARSLQGPTMLELQKQIHGDTNTFQVIFILGVVTFPLGNVIGGVLVDKMSPCLLLSLSMIILSLSNAVIPFSPNILTLAPASALAEFTFGFIDTGGNVYCLQLWKEKSGPYLNALYLSQGLGFMLAPVLAENVLPDSSPESLELDEHLNHSDIARVPIQHESIEFQDFAMFTPLQALYLGIALVILIIGLGFLVGIPADYKVGSYEFPQEPLPNAGRSQRLGLILASLMTFFSLLANGMSFTYGHFLTAYVVKGALKLSAQSGARLTTLYYASQVLKRGLNIALVTRFHSYHILLCDLVFVLTGSILVTAIPSLWGLRVGSVFIGLGAGSLFPMGMLWLHSKMEVSGKITATLCVATTLGAQLLRIPEGAFIDSNPIVHLYLLWFAFLAILVTFLGAILVASRKVRVEAPNSDLEKS